MTKKTKMTNLYQIYQKQVKALRRMYFDKNTPSGLNQKDFTSFVSLVRNTFRSRHQDIIELIEGVIEIIKSNSKGSFTDDGGNDCWYTDDLSALLEEQLTLIKKEI